GVKEAVRAGRGAGHRPGVPPHPRGFPGLEPERHLRDEAGQPHPSQRGEEELALPGRAARDEAAVRHLDDEPLDEIPERTDAMMVLAVHVTGDAPADGDELRARRHRREPAAREKDAQDLREGEPRLAGESAHDRIEVEYPVGARGLDDPRSGGGGYRGGAGGRAQPPGQQGVAAFRKPERLGTLDGRARYGMAAPSRDGLQAQETHRAP